MKQKLLLLLLVSNLMVFTVPAQDRQWLKSAGGTGNENLKTIATDANGNVYISGIFLSPTITFDSNVLTNSSGSDRYVVKYDANGNVVWANQIIANSGYNVSYQLMVDENQNVYVVGDFYSNSARFGNLTLPHSSGAGDLDIYIVKYDQNGTPLWVKGARGNSGDAIFSGTVDVQGHVYAVGTFGSTNLDFGGVTLNSNGRFNMFLVQYDSDGNALWAQKASTDSYFDFVSSVASDAMGNSYVSGTFVSSTIVFGGITLTHSPGTRADTYLVKYDVNGNAVWAKSGIGTDLFVKTTGVATDAMGNIIVTGNYEGNLTFDGITLTNNGGSDIFTVKYDTDGQLIWAKAAGGTSMDQAGSVRTDSNGSVYISGSYSSGTVDFGNGKIVSKSGAVRDAYIAKYNADGTTAFADSTSGNFQEEGNTVAVSAQGDIYMGGLFSGTISFGGTMLNSNGDNDVYVAKWKDSTLGVIEHTIPQMSVYPNPASQGITLKISPDTVGSTYYITDVTGKIIQEGGLQQEKNQVDISTLSKGLYLLRIAGHDLFTYKLIKQ